MTCVDKANGDIINTNINYILSDDKIIITIIIKLNTIQIHSLLA